MGALETEHREAAAAAFRAADESFARSDTDGCVSQWCHQLTGQLEEQRADIVAAGGIATFPALLRTVDGARIRARQIRTRFGLSWAIVGQDGKFTGQFLPCGERSRRQKALGLHEGTERAPAAAKLEGNGSTGLGGLASVYVLTFRTDAGYPDTAVDL